jgi:hypothetical protein
MGLAVAVYTNIKKSDEEQADFKAYVIDDEWKFKIKNLKDGGYYTGDKIYSDSLYSCSTHNRFREALISLIGRDDLLDDNGKIKWNYLPNNIPFYDFINFADNQGCLDFEINQIIYNDFEKFKNIAKEYDNHYIKMYYERWLDIFIFGKEKGNVIEFY